MTLHLARPKLGLIFRCSLLVLWVWAISQTVQAQEAQPAGADPASADTVTLAEPEAGSLLLKTAQPGRYISAPMVDTDVDITVTGPIVRAKVTQIFENPSEDWVEGIYVFPLPEDAAVDQMRMIVGGRLIEGQIQEKQQARQTYETAKAEGKKAALVEQQRPNMFTASVANIGPGQQVAVQIEYQDMARLSDGEFSLRFPMTVAPRYSPPPETIEIASRNGGQMAVLDPVLDRDLISPPLMDPADEPVEYTRLPVSINVSLNAGFDLQSVKSPYHDVITVSGGPGQAGISLSEGDVPANRDFVLQWRAVPSLSPYRAVFTEERDGELFVMAMLTPPPVLPEDAPRPPRDVTFVIDTSGSMGGQSIDQAKAALSLALERLRPGDRFNVIRFSNDHEALFGAPREVSVRTRSQAIRWVSSLSAGGGTEMNSAMLAALRSPALDGERLHQVVFITDGAIGNERQLFATIQDNLDHSRLFPVGIGSAPNSYFMSRAASFGRGTYVQIGNVEEVSDKMGGLFKALESPVLTHITAGLPDGAELYPARLPDLYAGEPVVFVARLPLPESAKDISVTGSSAEGPWSMTTSLAHAPTGQGLSVLWARRKIAQLEASRFDRISAADIDAEILSTALSYNLVSRLTSFVAVDVTPSRPDGAPLSAQEIATMLPDGWDFATLTGDVSAPMSPPPAMPPAQSQRSVPMGQTASPHVFLFWLGLILLAAGWVSARRRPC